MPLRDHFRPPLDDLMSWDGVHGQWPAMIVLALAPKLRPYYVVAPRIHLGAVEIDVSVRQGVDYRSFALAEAGGSTATAIWAPTEPTVSAATDLLEADEYEVRVFDARQGRRLVAAVEIVSPANKDRPEHRRAFIAKCASLVQSRVSVTIVDIVTTRNFNLYEELLELLGQTDPSLGADPPPLYAATCRAVSRPTSSTATNGSQGLFEAWSYPLTLGQPLPTVPLWLTDDLATPLELETTYEETCRVLSIP